MVERSSKLFDIIFSVGCGAVLSIMIILFNKGSTTKDAAATEESKDSECLSTDKSVMDSNRAPTNRELTKAEKERVTEKLKKVQNLLGVTEDDINRAVEARDDLDIDQVSFVKILEWVIFILFLVAGTYFLNISTKGEVGRILLGLFSRELETLNLKNYFQRYDSHQMSGIGSSEL